MPANGDVWWLGDSIGTGGWLSPTDTHDSPPERVNIRSFRPAIKNVSVGGMAIHSPSGSPDIARNHILPLLQAAQADGTTPEVLVIALGANDIGSHGYGMWDSKYELNYLHNDATALGVGRIVVHHILPVTAGPECTEPLPGGLPRDVIKTAWVPELNARIREWNDWVDDMWASHGNVITADGALREDGNGKGDPALYFDGLHPNQFGSIRVGDNAFRQLYAKGIV